MVSRNEFTDNTKRTATATARQPNYLKRQNKLQQQNVHKPAFQLNFGQLNPNIGDATVFDREQK